LCSYFDVKFGYVKLMLNELLLLNYMLKMYWYGYFVVFAQIGEICCSCWWIVNEFIIICFGGCWVLLIMSIHEFGVDKLSCCWLCWFWKRWIVVWRFKKNHFNWYISHSTCREKSFFDVFEPWVKPLITLGEWRI